MALRANLQKRKSRGRDKGPVDGEAVAQSPEDISATQERMP